MANGQTHEKGSPMEGADRAGHIVAADRGFETGDSLLARLVTRGVALGAGGILRRLDERLVEGTLAVTLPSGEQRLLGGHGGDGPHAQVVLHNWRPLKRLISGGSVGWARSYIDGDWDSPALERLFELFSHNRHSLGAQTRGSRITGWLNRVAHGVRDNSRDGSRRNIAFHYDLGNDFYSQWLDPSMTYSSAIFKEGDNSLQAAQQRKYRRLLDQIDAKAGEHVLEIGCGWGGFAEIAARERGLKVTGITLSKEQLGYARQRIAKAGLAGQVDFQLIDYRDVTGQFDHIASIEMFEAVGQPYWQTFMDKVQELLRPGGRAGLQIITIDEAIFEAYRRGADFIQTYIFPGGMLPAERHLREVSQQAGLVWRDAASFGQHYAQTLAIWRKSFEAALAEKRIPEGFDQAFQRIWTYYLTYCEGGFRAGGIDVMQVALAKPR